MIHEATFDDTRSADACAKNHCTISEALQVRRNMRARHVILTHFSQRYPRAPPPLSLPIESSSSAFTDERYAVAFDFLQFYFPSQIESLIVITDRLVNSFAIVEEFPPADLLDDHKDESLKQKE